MYWLKEDNTIESETEMFSGAKYFLNPPKFKVGDKVSAIVPPNVRDTGVVINVYPAKEANGLENFYEVRFEHGTYKNRIEGSLKREKDLTLLSDTK